MTLASSYMKFRRAATLSLLLGAAAVLASATVLAAEAGVQHQSERFTQGIAITTSGYRAANASAVGRRFAEGVTRLDGLVYSAGNGVQPLMLDLYLPAKAVGRRPLLVYIHGGGWSGGDARTTGAFEDFPALLARFAAQGYAVASVNYRLSQEAPFPAPVDDIRAAITWLQDRAEPYSIDPQRVAVWGNSAGGHLVAMTALGCPSHGGWMHPRTHLCGSHSGIFIHKITQ